MLGLRRVVQQGDEEAGGMPLLRVFGVSVVRAEVFAGQHGRAQVHVVQGGVEHGVSPDDDASVLYGQGVQGASEGGDSGGGGGQSGRTADRGAQGDPVGGVGGKGENLEGGREEDPRSTPDSPQADLSGEAWVCRGRRCSCRGCD